MDFFAKGEHMSSFIKQIGIDPWLKSVRSHFYNEAPELLNLFDTYASEAVFGRNYIASDIARLKPGANILEVGAGSLLLSCQLVREGYKVVALEPIASGFSHFEYMRQLVLSIAQTQSCCPTILNMHAEDLDVMNVFDYAFSINVMEHVSSPKDVLKKVGDSLLIGGCYRFTCANYLFPYEPHFNIPTFLSKSLTEKLLGWKIFSSSRVPDPLGTWRSLNWINTIEVKAIIRQLEGLNINFNRLILTDTLERITHDAEFASRRSIFICSVIGLIVNLRLHLLGKFIPESLQPIMDCRIIKTSCKDFSSGSSYSWIKSSPL